MNRGHPKISHIVKRNATLVFSATKPPMNIRLWGVQTFEHLQRSLIRWLDGDIPQGEKIRRVQRLVTSCDQNGEVRYWEDVKTDKDVRIMMNLSPEIQLMVVIS